ncbi:MAG: hypothetical protein J7K66_05100, partial [Anaerolineaceae bacterium]|nr:hypothetical protein [Anaerolineaceae bacterium]
MSKKHTAGWLLLIGLVYFTLFSLVNTSGAENADMLAVFEIDEYAQYPHLLQMVTSGSSLKYTIRNFLVYGHYFYGYPFYFFSGLVLLPFRLLIGANLPSHTRWIIFALRQCINVLPNVFSAYILTYLTTRFRSLWKSTFIFTLLLLIPALVMNGFWWHPDGLGLFFISLTMLFLSLDKWRYSHFFYLAAVSAGIAAGIKYLGLFFVLTIPAYLLWGLVTKKINPKTTTTKAAFFLIVMVAVIIFTNPLLLLPLERSELIATQKTQFSRTSTGELIGMQPFFENGWLPHWFTDNFGTLPFLLALLCALYFGWRKKEHQLEAMLITTYI